jgi:hypothetical protein
MSWPRFSPKGGLATCQQREVSVAYSGGVDGRHRFPDGATTYFFRVNWLRSHPMPTGSSQYRALWCSSEPYLGWLNRFVRYTCPIGYRYRLLAMVAVDNPTPSAGPSRDRRSLPERGADRTVPLGPLLGQAHEKRHAGGMPFGSVVVSPRHLRYLLNQRNVLCLNRNHLFRSIRLRFAHNALPTQRNLPNWLVREQLMEAIEANLLSHQLGSFSQRSRHWSRFVTPAGAKLAAAAA